MHATMAPIEVDGPENTYAFTGLPILMRPDFGDHPCVTCHGHGCWNELYYPDSGRCRLMDCSDCDGFGWQTRDGHHVILDIVCEDGHPKWVVRHLPLPTMGAPMHTAVILPIDTAPTQIEIATDDGQERRAA